jgi:hypothetical protein
MFEIMVSASTGKQTELDVATKFEIIQACENGNVSKSEIGRRYNFSLSTHFTILENKILSLRSVYHYSHPCGCYFCSLVSK